MKRTFHIAPDRIAEDDVLLCEISLHHICTARADAATKKLKGLSYYELRNLLEPEKLQDVLQTEEVQPNNRIVVCSAFRNVLVMPASQFTEDNARQIFTATFGGNGDAFFFNELPAYNAVLVHSIPQELMVVLKSSDATHILGCGLQANEAMVTDQTLFVHFTSKKIYVSAVKEAGRLQLVQTYFYTAPLDVVYYLLSICQKYDFSQASTALVLSGLVSEDSAMYKELYQYFSEVRFWKPTQTVLHSEYSPHFFSSLYNFAACAL